MKLNHHVSDKMNANHDLTFKIEDICKKKKNLKLTNLHLIDCFLICMRFLIEKFHNFIS